MTRKREVEGYESTIKETFAPAQTAPGTEALAPKLAGTDRLATRSRSAELVRKRRPDQPRKPKPGATDVKQGNAKEAAVPPTDRILDLGESLTIAGAREFKERLALYLQVPATFLVLDGSRIAAVDTAGLQLLTAFCRELQERGLEVVWRGASASLWHGAATLGLVDRLRLQAP